MLPMPTLRQYRLILLLNILIVVPLGYVVRFANLPNLAGLHDFLGGILYQVFWILAVLFFSPRSSIVKVAIAVCLAGWAIEFLQLWQPPFLQAMRATLPGRLILGNTFTLTDLPQYPIGSLVGWFWAKKLKP
jgi:uncharacterized membrane protein YGL010W